jgi:hypothetical protein
MQAYATAERIPEKPELRISPSPYCEQAGAAAPVNTRVAPAEGSSEARTAQVLALLVIDGLDEATIALLARPLAPHLQQPRQSSASCLGWCTRWHRSQPNSAYRPRPSAPPSRQGNCERSSAGRGGLSRAGGQ